MIACAGVPLVTSEHQVLGMLCAIDSAPKQWSEDDIAMLRELASLIGTELARADALMYEQKRNRPGSRRSPVPGAPPPPSNPAPSDAAPDAQ